MSIEEVMEKARIELPNPIDLETAENLLDYIADKLPASINYKPSYHRSTISDGKGGHKKIDGTVNITASIRNFETGAFDSLEFEPSKEDTSKLSAVRFTLIPGYDEFSEYREEVKQLWDDVRKLVIQYLETLHVLREEL